MPRVKRGTVRRANRKKLAKLTKGYFLNKSKLYRFMKEAADKAGRYAYRGRRSESARTASSGRRAPGRAASNRPARDPLIGARVRHPKFGVGTILEVEGEGEDRKLTVSFQDYGAKKFLERYANLQLA